MSDVERYEGSRISVLIHEGRCIHSRNCVLAQPEVFVPNADGAWVHPDAASAEIVADIARSCPSGAITFERHDGGPPEAPPAVNTIRVRENGPLALNAELSVAGDTFNYRATLCRCGASRSKPYCDGSHHEIGFVASGEAGPKDGPSSPSKRDGLLEASPTPNGPLMLVGAVEIVTGTGRTIARTEKTFLCRCGASKDKPFCDGSHKRIGFIAE